MSGRRSHPRFELSSPWDGALRMLQDVAVERTTEDELLAVSDVPGSTGEEMSLELLGGGTGVLLKVRVIESRPVIVNGRLRHRLRLAILSAGDRGDPSSDPDPRALDRIAGSR